MLSTGAVLRPIETMLFANTWQLNPFYYDLSPCLGSWEAEYCLLGDEYIAMHYKREHSQVQKEILSQAG